MKFFALYFTSKVKKELVSLIKRIVELKFRIEIFLLKFTVNKIL